MDRALVVWTGCSSVGASNSRGRSFSKTDGISRNERPVHTKILTQEKASPLDA
jgi:hypothetical protein